MGLRREVSAQNMILWYVIIEKPQRRMSSLAVRLEVYYYIAKKSMVPFSIIIPGAHLKYHIIA